MPLDPRISLAALTPQIQSPLDSLHKGASLEALQAQSDLMRAHAAKYAQDAQDEKDLIGSYIINPATGEVDVPKTRLALAAKRPSLAMKFDQWVAQHEETMLKRSQAAQETERRVQKDRLDAIKKRGAALQDLNRKSVLAAYQAQWNGQDPTAAGHQAYMTGLQELHQGGVLSANANVPAQFDLGKFEQAAYQDPSKWEQFAAQDEGDTSADMGEGGGGQFVPAVQTTGGPAAANAIQAAQAPGQPQAPAPVALPAVAPAQPAQATGGEMVPVAGAKKPTLGPEYQIPPTVVPQFAGKGQDWMKTYAFNAQILGMKNPASSPVLVDPGSGKVIHNEPLLSYRERVAKAGKTELKVENIMPGAAAKTELEKDIIGVSDSKARLQSVQAGFKPEFLQLPTQAVMKGLEFAEKAGITLSPENKARLTEYSEFTQNAMDNLNRYIKFVTGAQMGELEAVRIRKSMPDPEKDSPTVFKAHLDNAIKIADAAGRRYMELRQKGLSVADAQALVKDSMEAGDFMKSTPPPAVVPPKGAPKAKPAAKDGWSIEPVK